MLLGAGVAGAKPRRAPSLADMWFLGPVHRSPALFFLWDPQTDHCGFAFSGGGLGPHLSPALFRHQPLYISSVYFRLILLIFWVVPRLVFLLPWYLFEPRPNCLPSQVPPPPV